MMHGRTLLTALSSPLAAASGSTPSPHLSSAHTLPWFLLSLLDWSRFIREATMRFGVDNR